MMRASLVKKHRPEMLFDPEQLVIHAMGEFIETNEEDGDDLFAPYYLDKVGLCAHYFVCPSGVVVQQLNRTARGAHARGFNSTSVGIEFLVPGVHTYASFVDAIVNESWWTLDQYLAGVELARFLWNDKLELVRHSDIAPGRKADPGPKFPWDQFVEDVTASK